MLIVDEVIAKSSTSRLFLRHSVPTYKLISSPRLQVRPLNGSRRTI